HTTWVPDCHSPLEALDKMLEDNQGNLAQFWAFSGGNSPISFARHYALEDIGVEAPEPDWENRKNLTVKEWIDPAKYADRAGAGVLKFVRKAAEKGIYTALLYTEATPEWSQQF